VPKLRLKTKKLRRPLKRERFAGLTVTVQRSKKPGYAAVVVMRRDGKRIREKYLFSKSEAEALAQRWAIEAGNTGAESAASITDADKRFIMEARQRLSSYGKTLQDALAYYLAHLEHCKASITISDLSDRLQLAKQREKRSIRYQDDLRLKLNRFTEEFGKKIAAEITTEEISRWLASLELSPVSVANYRRVLSVLFGHGVSLRACDRNPVIGSFSPKTHETAIGILSVGEAAALLAAAAKRPEILPAIAIGLFAGVRDEEIHRLDWQDVNLESGYIQIKAANAKSARRRLIEIRPALRGWLEPHRKLGGPVWPSQSQRGRILHEEARREAGFGKVGSENAEERASGTTLKPWPHNALRHSFASYAIAMWKNAPALALEMGHTNASLIFQHYREIVLPSAAESYWALTPMKIMSLTMKVATLTTAPLKARNKPSTAA
jgi:integrase